MTSTPADLVPTQLPTVVEYLTAAGVRSIPVYPDSIGAPSFSISEPAGWLHVGHETFPGVYGVWTAPPRADWSDNALLTVGRLTAPVDSTAVLRCAFTECHRMPEWTTIHTNRGDYYGLPSAAITGTYAAAGQEFSVHMRYLIIDSGTETLLAQLTITVDTADAQRRANAERIFEGLRVSQTPPGPTPQVPQAYSPGVTVRVDTSDRLLDVSISAEAHQQGPQELSALIMDAYRQAVERNPSPDLDLQLPPN